MGNRFLSWLLGLLGLFGLLCAAYLYLQPPSPALSIQRPGLVIEEGERICNDVIVGRVYDIEFRFHNQTARTRRIIGTDGAGGDAACLA